MQTIADQLEKIIDIHVTSLREISESEFRNKTAPGKWSKKEILGHLADSAQNNIRRFIVAQYEDRPKIVYKQDQWVAITNYQDYDSKDLVEFWFLLNKHICHVLRNMPPAMTKRETQTEDLHNLEWLATDYVKHLLHHLHQVLDLEPISY